MFPEIPDRLAKLSYSLSGLTKVFRISAARVYGRLQSDIQARSNFVCRPNNPAHLYIPSPPIHGRRPRKPFTSALRNTRRCRHLLPVKSMAQALRGGPEAHLTRPANAHAQMSLGEEF